jgi:hypothetical protein
LSFSIIQISTMRLREKAWVVVDLTKHLSEEETVALLEGDALPVSYVRPPIMFPVACEYRLA